MPKHKTRHGLSFDGNNTIGARVRVFWDGEEEWFHGIVADFRPNKKKQYYVHYDDGEEIWEAYDDLDFIDKRAARSTAAPTSRTRKNKKEPTGPIDTNILPTNAAEAVGWRVQVYWDGEQEWFEGKVTTYDHRKGCRILYDDGEHEWERFKNLKFVQDDDQQPPSTSPAASASSKRKKRQRNRKDEEDHPPPPPPPPPASSGTENQQKSDVVKVETTRSESSISSRTSTNATASTRPGQRVKVYWDGEKEWFFGRVMRCDAKRGCYVRYEDKERIWEAFGDCFLCDSDEEGGGDTESKSGSPRVSVGDRKKSPPHGQNAVDWVVERAAPLSSQQNGGSMPAAKRTKWVQRTGVVLAHESSKGFCVLWKGAKQANDVSVVWETDPSTLVFKEKDRNTRQQVVREVVGLGAGDPDVILQLVRLEFCDADFQVRKDHHKMTLLAFAASEGLIDVVQELQRRGANMNKKSKDGSTALIAACKNGHLDTVRLLLNFRGIDVECPNRQGMTPLMIACAAGHREIAQLLVHRSANVTARNARGQTALDLACVKGHAQVVNVLLDKKSSLIDSTETLFRLIKEANLNGHTDVVQHLVARSSAVKLEPESSGSPVPLYLAVQDNIIEMVNMLLDKGVDPNQIGSVGRYPLMECIEQGNVNIYNALIRAGADLGQVLESGMTIFAWACSCAGFEEMIPNLVHTLREQAKVKHEPILQAGLMAAVENGQAEVLKQMINEHVDIDLRDSNGWCALKLASFHGNCTIVEILLDAGADVNHTNSHGQSALMWCSVAGRADVARLLIQHKAECNVTDLDGQTPLTWAIRFGHEEVVKILIEGGADVNFKSKVIAASAPVSGSKGIDK